MAKKILRLFLPHYFGNFGKSNVSDSNSIFVLEYDDGCGLLIDKLKFILITYEYLCSCNVVSETVENFKKDVKGFADNLLNNIKAIQQNIPSDTRKEKDKLLLDKLNVCACDNIAKIVESLEGINLFLPSFLVKEHNNQNNDFKYFKSLSNWLIHKNPINDVEKKKEFVLKSENSELNSKQESYVSVMNILATISKDIANEQPLVNDDEYKLQMDIIIFLGADLNSYEFGRKNLHEFSEKDYNDYCKWFNEKYRDVQNELLEKVLDSIDEKVKKSCPQFCENDDKSKQEQKKQLIETNDLNRNKKNAEKMIELLQAQEIPELIKLRNEPMELIQAMLLFVKGKNKKDNYSLLEKITTKEVDNLLVMLKETFMLASSIAEYSGGVENKVNLDFFYNCLDYVCEMLTRLKIKDDECFNSLSNFINERAERKNVLDELRKFKKECEEEKNQIIRKKLEVISRIKKTNSENIELFPEKKINNEQEQDRKSKIRQLLNVEQSVDELLSKIDKGGEVDNSYFAKYILFLDENEFVIQDDNKYVSRESKNSKYTSFANLLNKKINESTVFTKEDLEKIKMECQKRKEIVNEQAGIFLAQTVEETFDESEYRKYELAEQGLNNLINQFEKEIYERSSSNNSINSKKIEINLSVEEKNALHKKCSKTFWGWLVNLFGCEYETKVEKKLNSLRVLKGLHFLNNSNYEHENYQKKNTKEESENTLND